MGLGRKNGQRVMRSVHRLVAEAFIGPCPEGLEVNHKNGQKQDNRPENLEYVTTAENLSHARTTGLIDNRGCRNHFAKLTEVQVREIRRQFDLFDFHAESLAEQYNVDAATIRRIWRGATWKHL